MTDLIDHKIESIAEHFTGSSSTDEDCKFLHKAVADIRDELWNQAHAVGFRDGYLEAEKKFKERI